MFFIKGKLDVFDLCAVYRIDDELFSIFDMISEACTEVLIPFF